MNKLRNSSIELLRIIAQLGVIILHYNNPDIGGALKHVVSGSLNHYYLCLSESAFICAVNVYVIISSFFLSNSNTRKVYKIVELYLQVICFNFLFYIVSIMRGASLNINSFLLCLLPNNYFVVLYSVLYIISPYINLLTDKLNKKQFQTLVLYSFGIFSVWSYFVDCLELFGDFSGMSPIGMRGSQAGYTIVNFALLFLIGSYIKKNEPDFSNRKLLLIVFACIIAIFFISIGIGKGWNYNSPFVILLSATIFMLFNRFDFKNDWINKLASASFTCFLVQERIVLLLSDQITEIANRNIAIVITHQIGVSVSIFLFSYIIHILYSIIVKPPISALFRSIKNSEIRY